MPPKGKKGKSEKKKKEPNDLLRPSEKELILQTELDNKVRELAEIKQNVRTAQEENNWLNEEADKVRAETAEYVQYMSKKTNIRQTQIVTLTDYHRQEIDEINRDKENMLKEYEQKKAELKTQLMRKEQLLAQTRRELQNMEEYKSIQEHQNSELKRLQEEIVQMRSEHVQQIAKMRTKFEQQLRRQRVDEEAKVEEIRRQADQEADQFLYDRTLSIQDENVELRQGLQKLLKQTQALSESRQRLEEEQLHLIRRLKLAADLRRIRLNKVGSGVSAGSSKSTPKESN